MSKPAAGSTYIVQAGDDSDSISKKAYGDGSYSSLIDNANQSNSGIKTGDTIIIPAINTRSLPPQPPLNTEKNTLSVLINGRLINLESASIVRSIDSGAYGFSGIFPWEPGLDPEIDSALLQYKYPDCHVYIGDNLIFSGVIYSSNPSLTKRGRIKSLDGASYTADAIDSTIKPPYEKNNVTLEQRANELIAPIGIALEIEGDTSTGGQFTRITAEPEDTIFSHIAKLATQRGFLVSTNPAGNMVFRNSDTSENIGLLQEGDGIVTDWEAVFDGRKRFNSYRAIGQSPGENSKPQIANDDAVPRTRFLTFQLDDTTKGDIKNAAEWKRSKQLAESQEIALPVNTWYAPNGQIWEENKTITIASKTLSISNFEYLIKSVEYNFSSSGKTAILTIVPPQVYTGENLIDPTHSFGDEPKVKKSVIESL